MKLFLEKVLSLFFILCVVFIPLNFDGKGFQFSFTSFIFHDFIRFTQNIFSQKHINNIDFSSDTISLNLLIVWLLILSFLSVAFLKIFHFRFIKLVAFSRLIIVYYLAFILLKYGFNKIFKSQFYLPEPNILYSKFGNLSRDTLYWSTIGISKFYSVSLGITEGFTAFLLLINRTRTLGLLFAIVVFTNVILVNFGFDISVKTISILLLLMTVYVVFPNFKAIFSFFTGSKMSYLFHDNFQFCENKSFNISLKFFVVCLMMGTIFLPFAENRNFNDDDFPRPYLHGAYKVVENNQKESAFKIVQFYIHRKNYLIFEFKNGQSIDYLFEINKLKKQIKIINYQSKVQFLNYKYSVNDSVLELDFRNIKVVGKAQNWRKMSVLQNDLHFVIDQ